MSTLAETVEYSLSELERLTALGIISEDLAHHLLAVMNISRTGRLFGHDSAVSYPKKILEMTEACTNSLGESSDNFDDVREAVSKKFAGSRARKPTELNRIISSVVDEITRSPTPHVLNLAGTKKSWFSAIFKR